MRDTKTKKPKTVKTPSEIISPRTDAPPPDEIAYEDSWYRSLKAVAQRRQVDEDEEAEGSEG